MRPVASAPPAWRYSKPCSSVRSLKYSRISVGRLIAILLVLPVGRINTPK